MAKRINWKKLAQSIPPHVWTKKGSYETLYTEDFKDGKTLGESRFDPKQIVLKKGLTDKELVHVFFHELIHVSSDSTGAGLTENQVLALEKDLLFWIKIIKNFNGNSLIKKRGKRKRN